MQVMTHSLHRDSLTLKDNINIYLELLLSHCIMRQKENISINKTKLLEVLPTNLRVKSEFKSFQNVIKKNP